MPDDLLTAARQAWDDALDLGEVHGYRNAQATVLAPTGTISFMMDCDTTGVEPDFSLVKSKKLVGGGEITIVNKTVPMALEKLGYAPSEVDEIVAFIDERNTVVGAPYVKTEHYPVFDCAIGDRAIHYMGHVKMMGAVQPFISGAISKTVNLPEAATVEDVAQLFVDVVAARREGDRDLPRQLQGRPAALGLGRQEPAHARRARAGALDAQPQRRRLPDDRVEVGRKFRSATTRATSTSASTRTARPGDIFVDIAKEGTTLAGLMNSFMISVSLGLQYGVPLEVYVSKFAHMRFEPSGPDERRRTSASPSRSSTTSSAGWARSSSPPTSRRRSASSPPRCAPAWPPPYATAGRLARSSAARAPARPGQTALFNAWEDAVECARCGGRMVRTGSCYTCRDCGTNTGCS